MDDLQASDARRLQLWLQRQYEGLMRADHWLVGIVHRPIHTFLEEPHVNDAVWFPAPVGRDRYIADPFGIGDPDNGMVLVEDYDHSNHHGRISAYRMTAGKPTGPFPVLELTDHASYPYLVHVDGKWWCVPENAKSNTVRAFHLDNHSLQLTKPQVLLEGVRLLDPTIFEHNGLWWLFGTDLDRGANDHLRAWWANEPLGLWTAHRCDPLKVDPTSARSAGTPFTHDGALYRPTQDCSTAYGSAVSIQHVKVLTPDAFEEECAAIVRPDPTGLFPDGVHTLSAFGDTTLIDGNRRSFSSAAFRRELTARSHVALQHFKPPTSERQSDSDADPNLARYESQDRVDTYNAMEGITPAEQALFQRWIPLGSRILDLGVGTGRTYPSLSELAGDYVGVDYSTAMVDAARVRFPDGRFEVGDAADLGRFHDATLDVVVFSYNGLDSLHPFEKRHEALAEIRRVLRPGGILIMSSHNPRAVVRQVKPENASHTARLRALAISAIGTARASRSLLPTRTFWSGTGYETDRIQGLITYYTTANDLVEELGDHGFRTLDLLPGDHPEAPRSFRSPWTYVAAARVDVDEVHVERLTGSGPIAGIANEWDALSKLPGATTFQARAWVEAWAEVLEPDARLLLFTARHRGSGRLVGLLATARLQRRLHSRVPLPLRYVGLAGSGKGAADHLGPLAESDEIGAILLDEFRSYSKRRPILLENISPRWTPVVRAVVGGNLVRRTECPAAVRSPDDHFSGAWSAKMRKNVRRRARQLDEAGVDAEWIPAGNGFAAALDGLQTLHSRRWKAIGASGLFDSERARFLLAYAERCTAPDTPWILLLRQQSGEPVAGLLGFRHLDTFSVYKTGWDPEFARLSPGIALGAEAMRWAEEQGLTNFDYLRGPHSHKRDLGCEPVADMTFTRAGCLSGHLLEWRERLSSDGVVPEWASGLRRRRP